MPFRKRTWEDRDTEYPNRRKLIPTDGSAERLYLVERAEGLVYLEGDTVEAANMNNLENRIGDAFGETEAALAQKLNVENPQITGTTSADGDIRLEDNHQFQFWGDGLFRAAIYPASGYMVMDTIQDGWTCREMDTGILKPIYASNTSGPSSRRYKKDIADMQLEDAQRLLAARVCDFEYTKESGFADGERHYGLIAEELEKLDKRYVYYDIEGAADGINYTSMVPVLLRLVQSQQAQIDDLEKRLAGLEEMHGV